MEFLPQWPAFAAPAQVWVTDEQEQTVRLTRATGETVPTFAAGSLSVRVEGVEQESRQVLMSAPDHLPRRLHLRWDFGADDGERILGDHYERGYGDLEWRSIVPERKLPWYFASVGPFGDVRAWGVQTGANAFCWWQCDQEGISLYCDVSNGGRGVQLGNRVLHVASLVWAHHGEEAQPFLTEFCRRLCTAPRLPDHVVYGSNNWYYAYGTSSHDEILRDTDLLMAHAPANARDNPPYMIIDDGWQAGRESSDWTMTQRGPWNVGCSHFPDMGQLADEIRQRGARPGIWIRPLGAVPGTSENRLLPSSRLLSAGSVVPALDPSVPENLATIADDFRTLRGWGYDLIKHDWTTYDILGRWGFEMNDRLTNEGWHFADWSRTTAEIIGDLYRTIRGASGDALLIGCNTVGHLTAGTHELQRTGDDTSGKEWERTRKMGINTLAFRMCQHNTFFAVDADCVGLTRQVPWRLNRQWLDLLARSGTPLFVSSAPDAISGPGTAEQSQALRDAFARASVPQPAAEPLDWMDTTCPRRWRFGQEEITYNWSEFAGGEDEEAV